MPSDNKILNVFFVCCVIAVAMQFLLFSQTAKSAQSVLLEKAKSGDPYSQFVLGLKYFNSSSPHGCGRSDGLPCPVKDEVKGIQWLKRAAKGYETSASLDSDLFSSEMCELYRDTAHGDQTKLKQAYLWALKGLNEKSQTSESFICMRNMYESDELKVAAPKVYKEWRSNRNSIYQATLKDLPDMVVEIRQELAVEDLPVFSYYFSEGEVVIEVYKDGRSYIQLENAKKEFLMQTSLEKLQQFLHELKSIGFYQWTMVDTELWICGKTCKTSHMQLVSRAENGIRRLFLKEVYLSNFDEGNVEKYRMTPYQIAEQKKIIENYKKKKVNVYFAKLKVLMEKYFPNKNFRCGKLEKQKAEQCLKRDEFWTNVNKINNGS